MKTLLEQLRAMPPDLLDYVGSIMIECAWPTTKAVVSVHSYSSKRFDFDPADTDPDHVVRETGVTIQGAVPRPAIPRDVEEEPPVKMELMSKHPDIELVISGGDIWRQVVGVVESKILGVTEAAEMTVTEPPERAGQRHYNISGRGRARSPERMEWLARCIRRDRGETEGTSPANVVAFGRGAV